MKALDLFCGLGGWSDGLAFEGFEVLGVEIERKIARLYKHDIIIADIRTLNGENFKGFDLIVGSPPCRDFSNLTAFSHRWKEPVNVENGLSMVHAFLRIVEEAQPRFWLMENVQGLRKYLDLKPKCKPKLTPTMRRHFYGEFPPFLIPIEIGRTIIWHIQGPLRRWERARIPLPVAKALGKAVREALK